MLERLAARVDRGECAAAATIVREGEPADALYVILEGEVEVTARGRGGRRAAPADDGPPRPTSARSACSSGSRAPRRSPPSVPTRCSRIDGDAFLDALTRTPPARSFVDGARQRLATTHPSLEPTYEVDAA